MADEKTQFNNNTLSHFKDGDLNKARDPETGKIDLLRLPKGSPLQEELLLHAKRMVDWAYTNIIKFSPILEFRVVAMGPPTVAIFPVSGGRCPTAQVRWEMNNHVKFYQPRVMFNASFVLNLSIGDVLCVLVHEGLHDFFEHLPRMKSGNYTRMMPLMDCTVWNFVTDILINETLLHWYHMHGIQTHAGEGQTAKTLAEVLGVPEAKDHKFSSNDRRVAKGSKGSDFEFTGTGHLSEATKSRRSPADMLLNGFITWDTLKKFFPELAIKYPRKVFWTTGCPTAGELYHDVCDEIDRLKLEGAKRREQRGRQDTTNSEFPIYPGRLMRDTVTGRNVVVTEVKYGSKNEITDFTTEEVKLDRKDMFDPKYNLKNV